MSDDNELFTSPLNIDDIELIEATGLSSIDRHHLRIMAHCLACFKSMSDGVGSGPLPSDEIRFAWFMAQPNIDKDPAFVALLLEQFSAAEKYLEKISALYKLSPLELTLKDLIDASVTSRKNY